MTDRHHRKPKPKKEPRNKIGKKVVHSQFEWNTYHTLKAHLQKGTTLDYETETLPYMIQKTYVPDFIITFKDGTKIYVECKGYFKYPDREKMLAVKALNPDLDIRLVFQRNSPSSMGKGVKSRPSDWADKHGFPWAVGEIPKEWLIRNKNND